jgi:hypothetical protein
MRQCFKFLSTIIRERTTEGLEVSPLVLDLCDVEVGVGGGGLI